MISPFASNENSMQRAFLFGRNVHREVRKMEKKGRHVSCESCGNYVYDEEYGYYLCEASLDEDEMAAFLGNRRFECPYYVTDDEYRIVRRQM